MSHQFDYTAQAQNFTARFPLVSFVGIQVSYWTFANLFLVIIVIQLSKIIASQFQLQVLISQNNMLLVAIFLGIIYGILLGVTEYYLDRNFFKKLPLGKVILFKAMGSLAFLTILLYLIRFVFYDFLIAPSLNIPANVLKQESWYHSFDLLLIYYFVITLVINFINQVNKKYGPGVLLPLLLGKYRNPREEKRIFMFMDLKSSTSIAEQLGHLKYSGFIRDCFSDINEVLFLFRAQVYQYVGDEIVVTWPEKQGLKNHFCIRFYFACKQKFKKRTEYYQSKYGLQPSFKAGVHLGVVTAVEIGEIKKDIAYHGDTLNTAARIQGVCNEFNQELIASDYLIQKIGNNYRMKTEQLGMILLRGKTEKVGIVAVDWREDLLEEKTEKLKNSHLEQ